MAGFDLARVRNTSSTARPTARRAGDQRELAGGALAGVPGGRAGGGAHVGDAAAGQVPDGSPADLRAGVLQRLDRDVPPPSRYRPAVTSRQPRAVSTAARQPRCRHSHTASPMTHSTAATLMATAAARTTAHQRRCPRSASRMPARTSRPTVASLCAPLMTLTTTKGLRPTSASASRAAAGPAVDEPHGGRHREQRQQLEVEARAQGRGAHQPHARRRGGDEDGAVHRRRALPDARHPSGDGIGRVVRRDVGVRVVVIGAHHAAVHGVGPHVARLDRRVREGQQEQDRGGHEHRSTRQRALVPPAPDQRGEPGVARREEHEQEPQRPMGADEQVGAGAEHDGDHAPRRGPGPPGVDASAGIGGVRIPDRRGHGVDPTPRTRTAPGGDGAGGCRREPVRAPPRRSGRARRGRG